MRILKLTGSALLVLTLFGLAVLVLRPTSNVRLVNKLLVSDILTNQYENDLYKIIPLVVESTKFQSKWRINKAPESDCLNLYIIDSRKLYSDLPRNANKLINNCAFIGRPNIIAIDLRFIERFLDKNGVVPTFSNPLDNQSEMDRYRSYLLMWILSHEIGHILHGHQPAHLGSNEFEKLVDNSTLSHKNELEADEYAAIKIKSNEQATLGLTQLLLGTLNSEIQDKAGVQPYGVGLIYDYHSRKAVEFSRKSSHPEYIIRGVRILKLLLPVTHALRRQVDDFALLLKERK